jgi:hypothetical protein
MVRQIAWFWQVRNLVGYHERVVKVSGERIVTSDQNKQKMPLLAELERLFGLGSTGMSSLTGLKGGGHRPPRQWWKRVLQGAKDEDAV